MWLGYSSRSPGFLRTVVGDHPPVERCILINQLNKHNFEVLSNVHLLSYTCAVNERYLHSVSRKP